MMGTTTTKRIEPVPPPPLQEWRCPYCRNLLARVRLTAGTVIEIKCKNCNEKLTREAA